MEFASQFVIMKMGVFNEIPDTTYLIACASLLTAVNLQQYEENASGLRARMSFDRAVPL